MPRWTRSMIVAVAACTLAGGCGYTVRPPYNPTVKTIYLPVFKAGNRFRQDLNIKLTKMVHQEIIDRTPYRVVANPEEADVTLEGLVTWDDKNAIVENPYNLPRHIMATMSVNVTLVDNRTGVERRKRLFPSALVSESSTFDPEIGESSLAGFEKIMEKIARDIVNMLEDPWGEAAAAEGIPTAESTPRDAAADRIRQ